MGVKFDLILVLRSQFFEVLRETLHKHALEHLEAADPEKNWVIFFSSHSKYLSIVEKECHLPGHILGASGSPLTKKMAMSAFPLLMTVSMIPNIVTFELLMQAAFVADEVRGFMPEPARRVFWDHRGS